MQITIHDFSGVYSGQKFMQTLRESTKALWLDGTGIAGIDCYCDDEAVDAIREQIANAGIKNAEGIHFIDGGNYHYMSKIGTDMVQEPFTLVVFDHHPDMQPPRFGDILSCGGWVKKALDENKFTDNVIIIGVADHLVDEICAEIASHPTGARNDNIFFIRESELEQTSYLTPQRRTAPTSHLYISIDKDALSHADAATNWDQGSLRLEHMKAIITEIAKDRRIIGVDICGERARDFAGDEHHSVQEADALNDRTNRELVDFFRNLLDPSRG